MIVYFADRTLKVVGHASTSLMEGLIIYDDVYTEEIDSGVATLEALLPWTDETRATCEACATVGNYVLMDNEAGQGLFTIVESENDTEKHQVRFYAEDAGVDLINDIALDVTDANITTEQTLTEWVNMYVTPAGFEIGTNELAADTTKKSYQAMGLSGEVTVLARLKEILEKWKAEISFGYELSDDGFSVDKLYVNIHSKRGADKGVKLFLNKDVKGITTKSSVANIATALLCYGNDGLNLKDYSYSSPDNDYQVEMLRYDDKQQIGYVLASPSAKEKYGVTLGGTIKHIVKVFNVETSDKAFLASQGALELDKRCKPEVNYEVDVAETISGVNIGDTIYIVDEKGQLFLQSRLLKIERSVSNKTVKITLGDFLLKSDDISSKVYALAQQVQNMSLDLIVQAVTIDITSSNGVVFIDDYVNTTLTAHLYLNDAELTAAQVAEIGTVKWYEVDDETTVLGTGLTFTIDAEDEIIATNMRAKLEALS